MKSTKYHIKSIFFCIVFYIRCSKMFFSWFYEFPDDWIKWSLPDVRDSDRTFEILVERSKFRPDVRKNENLQFEFEAQKMGFQNFSLKQNGSVAYEYEYSGVKNIKYYRKRLKMTKNIFQYFPKTTHTRLHRIHL